MHIALRTRSLHPAAALIALLAAAPAPAAAQGPGLFEAFAARKEQSSGPTFGGIAITGYRGLFGLRVGGGLNLVNDDGGAGGTRQVVVYDPRCRDPRRCRRVVTQRSGGDLSPFGVNVAGWSADADLILEPLRPVPALRGLLLGFSPYVFAGIGGYGVRAANAADTSFATVSYGGGVHHNLLGWLGLGAEARYRQPLDNAALVTTTSALRDKVEYRVALSVSFGGKRRPPRPARDEGAVVAQLPVAAEPDEAPAAAAPTQELAARVMDLADGFVDTPYRYGGTSPEGGFDGAGFVQYVFGQEGVRLPRTARQMATVGAEVSTRVGSLRPGDLLLFANDGSTPDHVAIYVGRERIIHSSASGQGVRYDVLGEGERGQWFADHLVAARRVVEPARPRVQPRAPSPRDDLDRPDRAPKPAGSEP